MTVAKSVIYDGFAQRQLMTGDTLAAAEVYPATIATTNVTYTGQQLASGFIARSPGGASVETIDTAVNILAAISGGLGNVGVQNGITFRCRVQVTTAFAATLTATANTGITVTLGVVNASSTKDFLITVTNGTPAQTVVANSTNASAVLTGMSLATTALLSPGMVITNAVVGTQGFTILSVQPGVGVTLSGNATSTAANQAFNFSPTITIQGIGQGLN